MKTILASTALAWGLWLGASIAETSAPFDPEGGAYGGVHAAHDHGDGHHHHHDH